MSKKLTQEEFETKFYKIYKDQFTVVGDYHDAKTRVTIRCNKCGKEFSQIPNSYDRGHTKCPQCNKNGNTHITIRGVNDTWTTNPEVARLLVNSEEGYLYRINTGVRLYFKCPSCGKIKYCWAKDLKHSFPCCYCSNTYSYPNRFIANLLDTLKIKFETEFSFPNSNYRYDFYFNFNNINYLVEMDGGYGHGHVITKNNSIQEQLEIDYQKDILASKNNYKLIRIDCNYKTVSTRKEYICSNILNSELNTLFKFNQQILDDCDLLSQKSLVYIFVKSWENGIHSYDELKKILHIKSRSNIRRYAELAINLNLLDITYSDFLKEIRLASNKKLAITKGTPILCEQTGEIFYSIAEAERKMNLTSLKCYFSQNRSYCGTLSDGTHLTWKKLA